MQFPGQHKNNHFKSNCNIASILTNESFERLFLGILAELPHHHVVFLTLKLYSSYRHRDQLSCYLKSYTHRDQLSCYLKSYTHRDQLSCYLKSYKHRDQLSCYLKSYKHRDQLSCYLKSYKHRDQLSCVT